MSYRTKIPLTSTTLSRTKYQYLVHKTHLPIELPPPSIKNASSPVACWRVIGNHKQEAVKVAGCLSAITFKSQKESQNLKPTDQSKKAPTYLRVPAPQPPEPMISIARKQRVLFLREKSTFSLPAFLFLLWKKEMLIDNKRKKC